MTRVTGSLALDTLVFLYAVAAPGIALAWVALEDRDPVVLGAAGLAIGIFALPVLDFTLAVMLRTHISPPLLLSVATLILGAVGGRELWLKRRRADAS